MAFLMMAPFGHAQEIKTEAKLDSSEIRIGQQVQLNLSVQYRVDKGKQVKIVWPIFADTLRKEIEINSQSSIDTIIPDKKDPFLFIQTKTLYITSFDSGYWAIPPFEFHMEGDTTDYLTEPLLLQVGTIEIDTTLAIKDIKPPYSEEYTWIDWLKDNMYVVYAAVGVLALLILLIWLYRRAKNKPVPEIIVEVPKVPAHITALEKLEKLKSEKLWQEGKLKQYHISLSDIVREYIENRFKIPALEQTTDEILFGFRSIAIDSESFGKLRQLLIIADLVKFAKEHPLPNENEMSMNNAFDFVNGTKREEELEQRTDNNSNRKDV